jgi:hypothetical protein
LKQVKFQGFKQSKQVIETCSKEGENNKLTHHTWYAKKKRHDRCGHTRRYHKCVKGLNEGQSNDVSSVVEKINSLESLGFDILNCSIKQEHKINVALTKKLSPSQSTTSKILEQPFDS